MQFDPAEQSVVNMSYEEIGQQLLDEDGIRQLKQLAGHNGERVKEIGFAPIMKKARSSLPPCMSPGDTNCYWDADEMGGGESYVSFDGKIIKDNGDVENVTTDVSTSSSRPSGYREGYDPEVGQEQPQQRRRRSNSNDKGNDLPELDESFVERLRKALS